MTQDLHLVQTVPKVRLHVPPEAVPYWRYERLRGRGLSTAGHFPRMRTSAYHDAVNNRENFLSRFAVCGVV